jgi:predicted nucleotidyltransferase
MTTSPSPRPVTVAEVRRHAAELRIIAERHGVADVRVFGSVARNEATETSDLDLLVTALPGSALFGLSAFAVEVEDLLGVFTQVVTMDGVKPRMRAHVAAEAVRL